MAAKTENLDRPNSSLVIVGMLKGRLLVSLDLFELKTRRNARRRVHLTAFQPVSLMLAPSLYSRRKLVAGLSVNMRLFLLVLLWLIISRVDSRSDLHVSSVDNRSFCYLHIIHSIWLRSSPRWC